MSELNLAELLAWHEAEAERYGADRDCWPEGSDDWQTNEEGRELAERTVAALRELEGLRRNVLRQVDEALLERLEAVKDFTLETLYDFVNDERDGYELAVMRPVEFPCRWATEAIYRGGTVRECLENLVAGNAEERFAKGSDSEKAVAHARKALANTIERNQRRWKESGGE